MMLSASLWRMTSTPTWQDEIEDAAERLKGYMHLAHLLLTRCFLMSHFFLSVPDTLCSFSIRDFVDHLRFSQR